MSTPEERDQPELEELYTELETTQQTLDTRLRAGTIDAAAEIVNTIFPLLKEVVGATLNRTGELYDMVRPVELSRDDADDIGTLLGAFREVSAGNPELLERIDAALETLSDADEEDEDGDEEAPESGTN